MALLGRAHLGLLVQKYYRILGKKDGKFSAFLPIAPAIHSPILAVSGFNYRGGERVRLSKFQAHLG